MTHEKINVSRIEQPAGRKHQMETGAIQCH